MNPLRKFAAIAAASAALVTGPALAQGWYGDPYAPGWHGGYAQPYAYGSAGYPDGPRGYGPNGYDNYNVDAGVIDIPVCPPGYHLGRHARACWPN
jgi:hypothetical protein